MAHLFTILPYGPDHWLVQLKSSSEYASLLTIHHQSSALILESVMGYDSLLLRTRSSTTAAELRLHIENLSTANKPQHEPRCHHIPVCYDGPDMEDVAALTQLDKQQIIQLHSEALYTVRFLGFSPGFAYLDGLDPKLHLPRRQIPRTRMAAGAVAIGGSHAGIYTIPSPGGWNWLGHTDHPLFNPSSNGATAFTLQPGDTVKFTPNSCLPV